MRRTLTALLFGALAVCLTSGTSELFAQPGGEASIFGDVKAKSALRIYVDGDIKLSIVSRNMDFFRAALGDAIGGGPGLPLGRSGVSTNPAANGSDFFMDPQLTLNLDFEIQEAVSAHVTLETPFNVFNDAGGANTGVGGAITTRRILEVEQLFVRWENAFAEELTLQVGIMDYAKDFVGHGDPFLIDVAHSESAFMNPVFFADFGAPQSSGAGLVGSQEAAGVLATYAVDNTSIDFFHFTLNETFRSNSDDSIYGAIFERTFEGDGMSGSFGVPLIIMQNNSSSYLFTGGIGGSVVMGDSLELYGEGYIQAGDYGRTLGVTIDQEGAFAVYGGMRYTLPGNEENRPWFDISYWEISGDDELGDSNNENFVSLENNNDSMIIEDGYYGLDIDTNYRAIKVKGGFQFEDPFTSSPCTFQAMYGYFELQDNNGTADNTPASHDKLGDEVDLSVTYHATDYLRFKLGTGFLFDANALGVGDNINVTVFEAALDF